MKLITQLIALTLLTITGTATWAQYIWVDENGRKQFSDQPPPVTIPAHNILKSAPQLAPTNNTPSASSTPIKQQESLAEKNMAYQKRRDAQIAQQQKDMQEAQAATAKADTCKRAQAYKQGLDSGSRISQVDEKGIRSFMTDEQRTAAQAETNKLIQDCH